MSDLLCVWSLIFDRKWSVGWFKRDAIAPGGHLQGDTEQAEYFRNAIECDVVEKNTDSSSKSNPLRRRRKNILKSRRTFNKNSYDLFTVIT